MNGKKSKTAFEGEQLRSKLEWIENLASSTAGQCILIHPFYLYGGKDERNIWVLVIDAKAKPTGVFRCTSYSWSLNTTS